MTKKTLISTIVVLTILTLSSCKKDETNPIISLNEENPVYINLGEAYTEYGATATDDEDGDISSKIEISHSINPLLVNEYIVNYTVSDKAGNKSSATRIVNVKANLLSGNYQATSDTKNYSLEVIGTSTFNRITFRNFGEYGNQNIFYSKIYGDSIAIDTKTISIGNNSHRIFNARGYYSKNNQTFKIDSVRYSETITPAGSTNGETFIRREVWTK